MNKWREWTNTYKITVYEDNYPREELSGPLLFEPKDRKHVKLNMNYCIPRNWWK